MADRNSSDKRKRVVVALGGNALVEKGQPLTIAAQRRGARKAGSAIAEIHQNYDVIATHGNGPQIGALSLQSQSSTVLPDQTLDVLNAQSEGMIGYILEQELYNCLPDHRVATLLTLVLVDPNDEAMATPNKPVGPWCEASEWLPLAKTNGWFAIEEGGLYRRIVPSPEPIEILEIPAIEALLRVGVVPICAGGGGIAVSLMADGSLSGVEGVIDKDLTSALLATQLEASCLLLLTDVDAVYAGWGGDRQTAVARLDRAAAAQLYLGEGSMAPKVEAALRFVEATGGQAMIGRLQDAVAILAGNAGTRITEHCH
jgi:carbamate kinase